jgi:hypothetical protein
MTACITHESLHSRCTDPCIHSNSQACKARASHQPFPAHSSKCTHGTPRTTTPSYLQVQILHPKQYLPHDAADDLLHQVATRHKASNTLLGTPQRLPHLVHRPTCTIITCTSTYMHSNHMYINLHALTATESKDLRYQHITQHGTHSLVQLFLWTPHTTYLIKSSCHSADCGIYRLLCRPNQ